MLRKVIFTVLALALAWGFQGNVLYGAHIGADNIDRRKGRSAVRTQNHSGDHAKFLLRFSLDAFGALCGVLLTLGLGWMKDRPDAKNSDQLHKQGVTDK